MHDSCRLAPLSQGRIEPSDGTLQCSYHGWRFGGNGRAAAIPQAAHDSPHVEETACSSKRACAATYPTQVVIIAYPTQSRLTDSVCSLAVMLMPSIRCRDYPSIQKFLSPVSREHGGLLNAPLSSQPCVCQSCSV